MPLETTTHKNIVKLSVPAPSTKGRRPDEEQEQTFIIVYLHMTDSGMALYYSHHETTSRSSTVGPWDSRQSFQVPLNSIIRQMIMVGAMYEFWSSVDPKIGELLKPNDLTEVLAAQL